MTINKYTKRALLGSIIALILCCAMLIGTTFAWFTDTESSAMNTIQSSNLDISLLHSVGSNYKEVTETTKLFLDSEGKDILWEPGAETVENFRIQNDGSLALKYELALQILSAKKTSSGKDLTDAIRLYITKTSDGTTSTVVSGQKLGDGYVLTGELLKEREYCDYQVRLVWEPSYADNDFNVPGGLDLSLCVNLAATQYTYEKDGTDDQ